jgi:[ribosomal protein S18]-alanine N-acetyltransferase
MRYVVNGMTLADIPRVIEIEKLAYPSTWPASSYRKELQDNPLAHYIVERDTWMPAEPVGEGPSDSGRRPFPLSLLTGRPAAPLAPDVANIVGFAGLWLMVDEAHVTTIATHPNYRNRGLGELLLTSLIDIAYDIGARQVTLEVRVTNSTAQNLYRKYGFRETGVRPRYYSDNHEDALIMWTDDIMSNRYREQYFLLTSALHSRLAADEQAARAALSANGTNGANGAHEVNGSNGSNGVKPSPARRRRQESARNANSGD